MMAEELNLIQIFIIGQLSLTVKLSHQEQNELTEEKSKLFFGKFYEHLRSNNKRNQKQNSPN